MTNLGQYTQSLNLNLGGVSFSPSYFQAAAIVVLVFLLVLVLAQVRRHLIDWTLKGLFPGIFLGFLFVLLLEGFLVIGGKTAFTEVLGWKNAPAPLLGFIDIGRGKLVDILGVKTEQIPPTVAKEKPTIQDVINSFQSLNPAEAKKVKSAICAP